MQNSFSIINWPNLYEGYSLILCFSENIIPMKLRKSSFLICLVQNHFHMHVMHWIATNSHLRRNWRFHSLIIFNTLWRSTNMVTCISKDPNDKKYFNNIQSIVNEM
jgi:hypothetical protein